MSALEKYADAIEAAKYELVPDDITVLKEHLRKTITALADDLTTANERIKELEADAELGELVRRMPFGWHLCHTQYPIATGSWYIWNANLSDPQSGFKALMPEDILREALGEQ